MLQLGNEIIGRSNETAAIGNGKKQNETLQDNQERMNQACQIAFALKHGADEDDSEPVQGFGY